VEQLHIISENKENPNYFSGLFINYLKDQNLYDAEKDYYSFGNPLKTSAKKQVTKKTEEVEEFISTSKNEHNIKIVTTSGFLWDTLQEDAIEKGNLIHEILSKIKTYDDIDYVITDFINASIINSKQEVGLRNSIKSIVSHPKLKPYFNKEDSIYNERPILSKSGEIYIPDRLVLNKNREIVIIDYKTGLKNAKHRQQLYNYQEIIESMSFTVTDKILVYINSDIEVEYI